MHRYTEEQLGQYFDHIGYGHNARQLVSEDPLGFLTRLQRHHMARVPFENLGLHYSTHRTLSLDPEDLFEKIVLNGRGGYCMELNEFFAVVLRSIGFTLISIGARVNGSRGWGGWNHQANLVTVDNKRYLVDVGFGSGTAPVPVPLEHDHEFDHIAPMRGRLQYRALEEHTDPNQRVWVYSLQETPDAPWKDQYAFTEIEFFAADYAIMNLNSSTSPASHFTQGVMCVRTILDETKEQVIGRMILNKNYVKRRIRGEVEDLETLENEKQRIKALEKYFGVLLSPREQRGIRGLVSELK
ncbi:hypothetical protein VTK26DRAFT_2457 [Humicola hyalothermophila]